MTADHTANDGQGPGAEDHAPEAPGGDLAILWRRTLGVWSLVVVTTILIYLPTATDLVEIWWASATFNHGFLIPVISLYLAWERRDALKVLTPAPWMPAILAYIGTSLLWFVGWLADAALLQHAALVFAIQLSVPAIMGPRVARATLFPIVFLVFAIPAGEELIPPFRDLTAWFVVQTLELINIPVFWDGYFIEVPGGVFKVAEACAGVRYLIAGLALGALFANMAFKSWIRRLNVMILAVIVPIVANVVRASGIVLLAYYSEMEVAVGVDHLIYGWLFFVLVAFLLIGIGMTFSDRGRDDPIVDMDAVRGMQFRSFADGNAIVAAGVIVFLVVLGPTWAAIIKPVPPPTDRVAIVAPQIEGWEQVGEPVRPWMPRFNNIDAEFRGTYRRHGEQVSLYVGHYKIQRPGAELIQYGNTVAAPEPYDLTRQRIDRRRIGERAINIISSRVIGGRQTLMVWHTYWINESFRANRYNIKLQGMWAKLLGRPGVGVVAVAVPYYPDAGKSERILSEFLTALQPMDRLFGTDRQRLREAGQN